MTPKQFAISLLVRTKTGRRAVSSRRFRTILSAAVAFVFNLLYALYHGVLGVMNRSLWFIATCAFYGILATMRFSSVLCGRRGCAPPTDDTEAFVMRLSGVLLAVLSFVLMAVNYISLSQNLAVRHGEIVMIIRTEQSQKH